MALTIKRLLQTVARRLGFELIPLWQMDDLALARHLSAVIKHCGIEHVIEVGTNNGAYGQFLRREVGYRQALYSYEYDSSALASLAKRAADDSAWQTFEIAFCNDGAEEPRQIDGSADFHGTPLLSGLDLSRIPKAKRLLRLDNGDRDALVLKFLAESLDEVAALQVEIDLSRETIGSALQSFEAVGFALSGLFPITVNDDLCVQTFDCVLIRR